MGPSSHSVAFRLNANTNTDATNTNPKITHKDECHSTVVGGGCGASVGLT